MNDEKKQDPAPTSSHEKDHGELFGSSLNAFVSSSNSGGVQGNPTRGTAMSNNSHPVATTASSRSPPPSPTLPSQPVLSGERRAHLDNQGHVRNISWGLPSRMDLHPTPGVGGGGGLPPRPQHLQSRQTTHSSGNTTSKITIQDLVDHSPLETEADTYIQSTLDEVDPTRAGLSLPQTTILGNVPPDATRDAFHDGHTKTSSNISASSPHPSSNAATTLPLFKSKQKHKPAKSTAEDLWELTMDMQKLDRPSLLSPANRQGTTAGRREDDDGELVKTNSLVDNAVRIMRRHNSSIQRHTANDDDSQAKRPVKSDDSAAAAVDESAELVPEMSAADRWKKLKQTMQATSNISRKKSDDVASPDAEQDGGAENNQENNVDFLEVSSGEDEDGQEDERRTDDRRTTMGNSKSMINSIRKKRGDYKDFEDWIKFKRMNVLAHVKIILGIMIVATGVAAILYYLAGNPPCSNSVCKVRTNATAAVVNLDYFGRASASWWLLFICCRQAVTLSLARLTEAVIIDYFALRSKLCVRWLGPFVTLFIVQSNGWPFLLFAWGIFDFLLLFGKNKFAQHWLFWQSVMGLFNAENPSGNVPSSSEYQGVLIVGVVVSFVVAIKRFWLGLVQGRRTYRRYGEDLAKVMKKAVWIGQVAALARDIEDSDLRIEDFALHVGEDFLGDVDGDKNEPGSPRSSQEYTSSEPPRKNLISGLDTSSRRARLDELLGAWEEPDAKRDTEDDANIASIIQFRQSLTYLNEAFPFGVAFGPATDRQECVASAEAVYHRLMVCIPSRICLTFDVLALLAVRKNGELDEEKLKFLIKLFRPDRDGNLTLLDFAKSIDVVYKELRLLRASVANASRLDKAFESIFNIFFYAVLVCIILAAIGIDPLVLFASISGFILGFAFMIGAACSKYFEGLLLIFVRRPYDIGDRIALSNPYTDAISTGSQSWVVKDIDLYTTTVVLGATNEVSTMSNGSIAGLRIINCARSPKGSLSFNLKFPIDTSFSKLQVFKSAIEKFIKARPREWVSFVAFRASSVQVDLGYVEYSLCAQHRESWQNIGALLDSKAQLQSFALELSKKMDMRYVSPPMPVDLSIKSHDAQQLNVPIPDVIERERTATEDYRSLDVADSVAAMFGTRLSPTKTD